MVQARSQRAVEAVRELVPRRARPNRLRRGTLAGVVGGIVAGTVLAVAMMALNYVHGQDVWSALKFAALPFIGDRALQPGFDALAVVSGVISHFAVSIAWGILFGILAFGLPERWTMLAGAVHGVLVWAVMHGGVVPLLLARPVRVEPVSIALHVAFGLVLATALISFHGQRLRWPWAKQTA